MRQIRICFLWALALVSVVLMPLTATADCTTPAPTLSADFSGPDVYGGVSIVLDYSYPGSVQDDRWLGISIDGRVEDWTIVRPSTISGQRSYFISMACRVGAHTITALATTC